MHTVSVSLITGLFSKETSLCLEEETVAQANEWVPEAMPPPDSSSMNDTVTVLQCGLMLSSSKVLYTVTTQTTIGCHHSSGEMVHVE